jgi:hypothetical protein
MRPSSLRVLLWQAKELLELIKNKVTFLLGKGKGEREYEDFSLPSVLFNPRR